MKKEEIINKITSPMMEGNYSGLVSVLLEITEKLDKHIEESESYEFLLNDALEQYDEECIKKSTKPQEKCEHEWINSLGEKPLLFCRKCREYQTSTQEKEAVDWDELENEFFRATIHGKDGSRKTFNWLRNKLQTK